MQGWRISMEDAHAAILDLHAKYTGPTDEKPTDPDQRLAFFGVYDGHGGDKVALFTGENLHKIVSKQDSFAKGDIEQALKDGFLATDRAILEGSWLTCFCEGEKNTVSLAKKISPNCLKSTILTK
jgi:protein phosphatase 2C family protein 2/3